MTFTTFRRLLAAAAVFAVLSGADPAFAAPVRSDKPAEPEETVQAPNGLLVNKCVPEPLRHTISLRASDGLRTSGLALGSGNKGVVLEHENGRTSAAGCRSRGSWSTRATTSCCLRARG